MKYVTILGSTGSIGQASISVIQQHRDKFTVHTLVAKKNVMSMMKQCISVSPKYVCMICKDAAKILKNNLIAAGLHDIQVLSGMKEACNVVQSDNVDIIISAIVGIAGLLPTFSAIRAGKILLLANKETLVVSGPLFMKEAKKYHSNILPLDSEHNAIFQSLPVKCRENLGYELLSDHGISCLILTASGGAVFRILQEKKKNVFTITPKQACIHPNWSMGRKISVDSSTMMNKGLEYIEARYLFNAKSSEIKILLHPQSIVHSMIQYNDGSILAHLSPPNMQIPIAYALAYPERIKLSDELFKKLNINNVCYLNKLNFDQLDHTHYPCLQLAISASDSGQASTIILNAANEIAVEAFLNEIISFIEIPHIISRALDTISFKEPYDIEEILYIDKKTREIITHYITHNV